MHLKGRKTSAHYPTKKVVEYRQLMTHRFKATWQELRCTELIKLLCLARNVVYCPESGCAERERLKVLTCKRKLCYPQESHDIQEWDASFPLLYFQWCTCTASTFHADQLACSARLLSASRTAAFNLALQYLDSQRKTTPLQKSKIQHR